jgi:hypothetical protein
MSQELNIKIYVYAGNHFDITSSLFKWQHLNIIAIFEKVGYMEHGESRFSFSWRHQPYYSGIKNFALKYFTYWLLSVGTLWKIFLNSLKLSILIFKVQKLLILGTDVQLNSSFKVFSCDLLCKRYAINLIYPFLSFKLFMYSCFNSISYLYSYIIQEDKYWTCFVASKIDG